MMKHSSFCGGLLGVASLFVTSLAAADLGVPVTPPRLVNTNAATDNGQDLAPRIASDGNDKWIAVWQSSYNLNGTIGTDIDVFIATSIGNSPDATWSAPAALNSTAPSDGVSYDRAPTIACDGQGHWIVVWESSYNLGGTIGGDADILFTRSLDNGSTWAPVAVLNGTASVDLLNDIEPQIFTDNAGTWICVWRTLDTLVGTIGPDADLLISRSTDNGASWTYPVPLNTNATTDSGQDIHPRLATDGNGKWVAVWASNDRLGGTAGSDYDILVSRSDNNGATWTAPAALNSNAFSDSQDDTDPSIACDGAGHWVVVWSSADSLGGTIGTDRDILVSRSVNDGVTWSAPAALNANAATDSGQDDLPVIVADRAGHWVVVWHSTENLGGAIGTDIDIFISRSDDSGTTWTAPAALNSTASTDTGADETPCVAADAHGAWTVVWATHDTQGGTIGTDGDILGVRFALPDCNQNMIPDSSETDCNHNGRPDDCDIASGTSLDANRNGVPDECEQPPPACPADIAPLAAHDNVVNVGDLLQVINGWGACPAPCPPSCVADINHDCTVNVGDLLAIINAWGPCPGGM